MPTTCMHFFISPTEIAHSFPLLSCSMHLPSAFVFPFTWFSVVVSIAFTASPAAGLLLRFTTESARLMISWQRDVIDIIVKNKPMETVFMVLALKKDIEYTTTGKYTLPAQHPQLTSHQTHSR